MPEDVAAERLYVEIVADATGFRRDLKAKVDAAARNVRAVVTAQLDATRLRTEVRTAAREAARGASVRIQASLDNRRLAIDVRKAAREASLAASVKIKAELDARRLGIDARHAANEASKAARVRIKAELDAKRLDIDARNAAREAGKTATIKVGVSINRAQVARDLRAALREAAAGVRSPTVRVNVAADTTRMRTEISAARKAQELRPVKLRVDADTLAAGQALRALGGLLVNLNLFPAAASGILAAAGAVANLAGALFAATASASQAVGVLAIIPGLAGAAAQGLGVLAIGFLGIGKAISAMQRVDSQAGLGSFQSAASQVNNIEQIRAARQRLADARQQAAQRVADAEEQAAKRVASAEEALQKAQEDQRQAQLDLTKAREDAREELQQLAFDTRDAALGEQQAEIDLEHARLRLEQSRQSVTMTPLEKRQADLDYQKAVLALEEAKDKTADLNKENDKAQKAGIKGTDTYKEAAKALADARSATVKAETDLADARKQGAKDVAKAQADGARQVADAQRALQSALRSTGAAAGATGASLRSLGMAMGNISPAGRAFADYIVHTVLPRFYKLRDAVQGALLPPLQRGITAALPLFDTIQPRLVKTASLFGDMAVRAGELAATPLFRRDVATVMDANNVAIEHFGRAGGYLLDALRNLLVVTSPLVIRFSKLAESWAKSTDEATKSGRETGKMAAFFDRAWATAGKLYRIVRDVTVAIYNLGRAARPAGDTLLDSLARSAEKLRAWTADPANQARIQQFFDNVVPLAQQFGDLLNRVVKLLIRLGNATGGHTFDGLFDVLNAFLSVLETIDKTPGGGTILSTILLLSGAGLGLGLVSRTLGKILTNLAKFSKYSGASSVIKLLTGGRVGGKKAKTKLGDLADDAARMGSEIDKELPKDRKKSTALDTIGGSAGKTGKKVDGLSGGVKTLGKDAEDSAVRSGKLSVFFTKFRGILGRVTGPLGKVALLLTQIPGIGGITEKLGGLFSKIKIPKLTLGGGEGGLAGIRGFFSSITTFLDGAATRLAAKTANIWRSFGSSLTKFKLPSLTGVLGRIGTWFKGLAGGVGKLAGGLTKGGSKGLLGRAGAGAAKGGAKGVEGGPVGIIGGILAGVVGQLIGGGHGGARGAVGGAITGGATGAGIGGILGSFFPIIGNAVGAGVGGIVGAIIGGITGGKYWTAIGTFFTTTLPNWIISSAKKLPGLVISGLGEAASLQVAIGKWALSNLEKLPGLIGRALTAVLRNGLSLVANGIPSMIGWALANIPPAILDVILTGAELALKGVARLPNVFGWLLNMVLKIGLPIFAYIEKLPFRLVGLLAKAALKAPNAFGWLLKHGEDAGSRLPGLIANGLRALPGLIARGLRALPGLIGSVLRNLPSLAAGAIRGLSAPFDGAWKKISAGAELGLKRCGAVIRRHLGNIGADFRAQGRKFAMYWVAAMLRIADSARKNLGPAVTWVRKHLGSIRSAFASAGRYVASRISAAFSSIVSHVRSGLSSARNYATKSLKSIRGLFTTAGHGITSTVRSAFNSVYSTASSVMDKTRKRIDSILSLIKNGFSSAKSDIGKAWSGLSDVVAKPVRWIGSNVYNKGIKKVWDLVDDKVNHGHGHLPSFPGFKSGGIYGALPGYTPGRDVLNIPAIGMSGGEAIMRPEWTRAIGPAMINFWNRLARTGGVKAVQEAMQAMASGGSSLGGFKNGGIFPHRIAAFADGGILGTVSSGWGKFLDAAKGLFSGGLKKAADWVLDPILNAVTGAMAPSDKWGAMLGKLPPNMVKSFVDYLVKVIEPKLGGDPLGVVAAAKKYIGIGDDRGPNNNIFSRAFGNPGAPWCAYFVSTAIKDARAQKHYSGYPTGLAAGYDSMKHVNRSEGRAGDLATYNNGGHINIIEKPGGSGFWTIGGNQNRYVQRGLRYPEVVLRPSGGYALGGIIASEAKRMFGYEAKHNADKHESQTPLVNFMTRLSPSVMGSVMKALLDSKVQVLDSRDSGGGFLRDRGGPVPPGRHVIDNKTGGYEWVITPEAIDLLGGPQAVTALNSGATSLYRTARAMSAARPAVAGARTSTSATVQVYPRPGQSEEEIGAVAARRLGVMLQ